MKVLFVTRDKKLGMIATRIAQELVARNADIAIVAEGLSVAEWTEFYKALPESSRKNVSMVAQGPLDIKAPWDISPKDVFYNTKPDVVVCGLSSPIRAEAWFAAGTKNPACSGLVPLVVLDDNWGATYRCPVQADLVLTINQLGARLVESNPMYKGHDYRVEIIGDLSATAAQEQVPQATIDAFNAAKGDAEYVFILASQKWPESDDIVEIGLASCALSLKTGAKLVVIPRFHPGAKPEDRERWNKKVVEFSLEFPEAIKILGDQSVNTDHLATLANGVFAATGSALRAAAYAGKIPICVWTERLGAKLKAESGMNKHPLAGSGGVSLELTCATDVVSCLRSFGADIQIRQKTLLKPVPFDAAKAAEAILAIAKK